MGIMITPIHPAQLQRRVKNRPVWEEEEEQEERIESREGSQKPRRGRRGDRSRSIGKQAALCTSGRVAPITSIPVPRTWRSHEILLPWLAQADHGCESSEQNREQRYEHRTSSADLGPSAVERHGHGGDEGTNPVQIPRYQRSQRFHRPTAATRPGGHRRVGGGRSSTSHRPLRESVGSDRGVPTLDHCRLQHVCLRLLF